MTLRERQQAEGYAISEARWSQSMSETSERLDDQREIITAKAEEVADPILVGKKTLNLVT